MNLEILIVFLFIFLFFALYYVNFYLFKKRKNEIESFALNKGYEYRGDGKFLKELMFMGQDFTKEDKPLNFSSYLFYGHIDLSFTNIALFKIGGAKRITNVIIVPYKDIKIYFFDYSYKVGGSKNSRIYEINVGLYKTRKGYPEFYLRPENFFDRVVEYVGFDDIDIKCNDYFSKMYYLKGKDKQSILSFLMIKN